MGDFVLIAEDNQPPLHWKKGRIIEVFEGNDKTNRVVKVKTVQGDIVRPVVKLRKMALDRVSPDRTLLQAQDQKKTDNSLI